MRDAGLGVASETQGHALLRAHAVPEGIGTVPVVVIRRGADQSVSVMNRSHHVRVVMVQMAYDESHATS